MLHVISANGDSRFKPLIIEVVKSQRRALETGKQVTIDFDEDKAGYPGNFAININKEKAIFSVEFNNVDATRFPARIKAAARALYDLGYEGNFQIIHKNGLMTILQLK